MVMCKGTSVKVKTKTLLFTRKRRADTEVQLIYNHENRVVYCRCDMSKHQMGVLVQQDSIRSYRYNNFEDTVRTYSITSSLAPCPPPPRLVRIDQSTELPVTKALTHSG